MWVLKCFFISIGGCFTHRRILCSIWNAAKIHQSPMSGKTVKLTHTKADNGPWTMKQKFIWIKFTYIFCECFVMHFFFILLRSSFFNNATLLCNKELKIWSDLSSICLSQSSEMQFSSVPEPKIETVHPINAKCDSDKYNL